MRAAREERIARAAALATSDVTRFYHALLRAQAAWSSGVELQVAARFPLLLDFLEREAPPELAARARELRDEGASRWAGLVEGYWTGGGSADDEFFARAFLEPYAEAVCQPPPGAVPDTIVRCPCCGRRPVVAVLRQEFDGARRSLVCSLCQWEWKFRRILCPECREQEFDRLPVFHVENLPHLRIEACETCKHYLLSVDLMREPRAVPVVDDIAAVPLHLWAREQGYNRHQSNLLGL
jgi:FdhE protein